MASPFESKGSNVAMRQSPCLPTKRKPGPKQPDFFFASGVTVEINSERASCERSGVSSTLIGMAVLKH